LRLLYHTLLRTNPLGVPFIGTCQRCGMTGLPITAADKACACILEENPMADLDPHQSLPPLTDEPANHFDDLDGVTREEKVRAEIAKHKELLAPDATAPAVGAMATHLGKFELALATLHKDLRDLIDAIRGAKPV
jgi:hypothetical protein